MPALFRPSPSPFVPHDASWRQPFHLHYRPLFRALEVPLRVARGRVLDVGCGLQPYRALLGPGVSEYVGLDRPGPLSRPTVEGTAEELPFADASFDMVLSTQVLEHVIRPERVLREAVRVLRPGGTLVLTVPGVWPTHEAPHDYWRFTRHGVAELFRAEGLALAGLEALGGLWSVVGQMVNLELQRGAWLREAVPLVNLAAGWLDRRGAREDLALAWLATGTRAG